MKLYGQIVIQSNICSSDLCFDMSPIKRAFYRLVHVGLTVFLRGIGVDETALLHLYNSYVPNCFCFSHKVRLTRLFMVIRRFLIITNGNQLKLLLNDCV